MPDPDGPIKVERREERRAKNWPALLRLADGRELPCFVRDVSRTGAKVILPAAFPLERTFLLRIDQQGIAMQVRLAWRREHQCGVRIERMARLPRLKPDDDASAHVPEALAAIA